MNRLSRVAFLVTVALGALVPVVPGPARADPIGGVIVIPGTGTDLTAMRLRTSAGCPAQATAFYAKIRGPGFPPDGQVTTANTAAGMSHTIGFDVYVALIMRDYAIENHAPLGGRYDITVYCVSRLTLHSYGEFTGSLAFTSRTAYQAIGAAKATGQPPQPRALAGDGSALNPHAGVPPAPSNAAQGLPASPPTRSPSAGDTHAPSGGTSAGPSGPDPQAPLVARQFTSQRSDVGGGDVRWLVLSMLGAVLVVLGFVVGTVSRIRKRRSS